MVSKIRGDFFSFSFHNWLDRSDSSRVLGPGRVLGWRGAQGEQWVSRWTGRQVDRGAWVLPTPLLRHPTTASAPDRLLQDFTTGTRRTDWLQGPGNPIYPLLSATCSLSQGLPARPGATAGQVWPLPLPPMPQIDLYPLKKRVCESELL